MEWFLLQWVSKRLSVWLILFLVLAMNVLFFTLRPIERVKPFVERPRLVACSASSKLLLISYFRAPRSIYFFFYYLASINLFIIFSIYTESHISISLFPRSWIKALFLPSCVSYFKIIRLVTNYYYYISLLIGFSSRISQKVPLYIYISCFLCCSFRLMAFWTLIYFSPPEKKRTKFDFSPFVWCYCLL